MKKFLQTKGERETKGWTSVVSPEIRTRRALTTNYYGFQYFFTTSPSFALTGPMIHGGWLRINLFMQCKLELNSVQYISRKFYFHTVKLPFGSVLCSLYSHLKYEEQDTFFLPNQFVHTKSTKTLESQFLHKLMYTFWTISLSCGSITIWFCFFREHFFYRAAIQLFAQLLVWLPQNTSWPKAIKVSCKGLRQKTQPAPLTFFLHPSVPFK